MSNAVVSRLGQNNLSGSELALFLTVFAGEVLTQFPQKCKFLDKHLIKTIPSGKTAEFPVTGQGDAEYHVPGAEILGSTVPHSEKTISIDGQLIAARFIASIDQAMNHYDTRSIYSADVTRALAVKFDRNVAQVITLAARASAVVTGGSDGKRILDADADTSASSLAASIFAAAENFDEKEVPEEDRFVAVRPRQYSLLVQNKDTINKDWGGDGMYAENKIYRIAGMTLFKTNHIPSTTIATGPAAYQGVFGNTVALCFTRGAAGTVKLIDIATEAEWDMRRQGHLVLAKYAMGHGILRPECAAEIYTS